MSAPDSKPPDHDRMSGNWQTYSLATAIPVFLLVAPLLGFFAGKWIGAHWDAERAGSLAGLAIGLVSGIRETIKLIRRLPGNEKRP